MKEKKNDKKGIKKNEVVKETTKEEKIVKEKNDFVDVLKYNNLPLIIIILLIIVICVILIINTMGETKEEEPKKDLSNVAYLTAETDLSEVCLNKKECDETFGQIKIDKDQYYATMVFNANGERYLEIRNDTQDKAVKVDYYDDMKIEKFVVIDYFFMGVIYKLNTETHITIFDNSLANVEHFKFVNKEESDIIIKDNDAYLYTGKKDKKKKKIYYHLTNNDYALKIEETILSK